MCVVGRMYLETAELVVARAKQFNCACMPVPTSCLSGDALIPSSLPCESWESRLKSSGFSDRPEPA